MTVVQKLPGTFTITDPDWPRFAMWTSGQVFTSDSFSEPGDLAGRMTDAALGGTPVRWVGDTGIFYSEGGAVAFGDADVAGSVGVEVPADNLELSFTVSGLPTEGFLTIFLLRDTFDSNPHQIMCRISSAGATIIRDERGGDTLLLGSVNGIQPGDKFTIKVEGESITSSRNGTQWMDAQSRGTFDGRYVGFFRGRTTRGGRVDDYVITAR